ncbi:MAG: glycosyltransferase family 1 protein [Candidatus Omnitrophota bacterium]|nr:MAG: glycosyltransferase family 1 protein [Candidatus Omnitrophota bacterium]
MQLKIALIFNHEREDTTGGYFKRALEKTQHRIDHYWTRDAEGITKDYDLYLRIDHGDYKYDLPQHLKPQVFLAIDTHLKKPFRKIVKQARHYDFVMCVHRNSLKALKWRGISAEWLPVACDPQIHKKLDIPKVYDIGFVGTKGKKSLREKLLEALGQRYPKSFLDMAPYTQMSRIYSASKIGFNYSIRDDINMRMFEIMSCGALLITNRIREKGFQELFEDRRHLVTYKNPKELFRLVDYYLEHEDQRRRIAECGRRLVISEHTYEKRTQKMLDYIKERLADNYPKLINL